MTTEKKLAGYNPKIFEPMQVLRAQDLNDINGVLANVNAAVLALEGQEGNGGATLNILIDYRTEWKEGDVLAAGMLGIEYDAGNKQVRFKVNNSEENDFWGNLSYTYTPVMKPLTSNEITEICK